MASIFTFDTEPTRVNSPWQSGQDPNKKPSARSPALDPGHYAGDDLDRLEAEPQDGPIEYKLHLLLRPRRSYKTMSTTMKASGSQQQLHGGKDLRPMKPPGQPLASSNQTKQNRLQHLTTQLLWRLQQSSPYHTTAKGDLVIPKLPDDSAQLEILQQPSKLLPGLEESNGALYEIGVSDDGTFVGLTKHEMDESMTTLKIMAASLGCRVEVQRMKAVGTCEWVGINDATCSADLWVAEALIMPILSKPVDDGRPLSDDSSPTRGSSTAEQLRVSLIGPTTSGKTSMIGTLSSGNLDNGRGSSRINLLKHQHEVASGRTSSVAQELIGYEGSKVCNYTVDNINAWPDIHDRADQDRLVFFLDSAGHPRYQRTTLRALVGWAPHWTVLCIAANESGTASPGVHSISGGNGALGEGIAYRNLAMAHLDLCLQLQIPLAIIITKYDLAQLGTLKELLNAIFTKVKAQGRTPKLLTTKTKMGENTTEIPVADQQKVEQDIISPLGQSGNPLSIVPVALTSAVKGDGIGLTHALLRSLPLPPAPTSRDFVGQALNPEQPVSLFHIDEVYELPLSRAQVGENASTIESAPVVTGYLRFGRMSIGDKMVVGPFPADDDDSNPNFPQDYPSPGYGLSLPHPSSAEYARLGARRVRSQPTVDGEWRTATIVNIRNLRLPVRTIEAGQAASIQVCLDEPGNSTEPSRDKSDSESGGPDRPRSAAAAYRIRKGQVLAMPSRHMLDTGLTLQASSGLTAAFRSAQVKSLGIGSMVNVYVGMVRAAARVQAVSVQTRQDQDDADEEDGLFSMTDHVQHHDGPHDGVAGASGGDDGLREYRVTLELLTNKEWIELGSQVVLVEGTSKDRSGLEGHVGVVVEVVE